MERVEIMLEAITATRARAKEAAKAGDLNAYRTAMGDLTALECSLVSETQSLIDELKKIA